MEAEVIINGIKLTNAQSMTLRAALTDFRAQMSSDGALGDDPHGRSMTQAYRDRASEVLGLIHQ